MLYSIKTGQIPAISVTKDFPYTIQVSIAYATITACKRDYSRKTTLLIISFRPV